MKSKHIISGLILLIFFCQLIAAQPRGAGISVKDANGKTQQLYEGSYALIIGNSEYSNGWERLNGVKSDVSAISTILSRHQFKVEIAENLTSDSFEPRIRKFINDYGFDRNNRLVIYYAGHGYTLNSAGDRRELGYIIPSDTPLPTRDERGFRQKAIDMYAIQRFARQIQAKHALFVFDSCFSGKLFALRDASKIPPFIIDKVDNPVRQFITAGNETQTVPDESIFRKAFVRGLEGDADRNGDTDITGTELADYLKEVVTNYSERRQTPQYGLINDIDLDRGDFVFVKPLPKISLPPNPKTGEVVKNIFGMEFVYIPAGKFLMGIGEKRLEQLLSKIDISDEDKGEDPFVNEIPQRQVTIRNGFWMGKFEITKAQWTEITKNTPYSAYFSKMNDDTPAVEIDWDKAENFIRILNKQDPNFEYRLPTESEWEYAARAGTVSDEVANLQEFAWYARNSGDKLLAETAEWSDLVKNNNRIHPVGKKKPNLFGLYDMLGNAFEFVQDVYSENYEGLPTDGAANLTQGELGSRIIRGCSWRCSALGTRLTDRTSVSVNGYCDVCGFRLVAIPKSSF